MGDVPGKKGEGGAHRLSLALAWRRSLDDGDAPTVISRDGNGRVRGGFDKNPPTAKLVAPIQIRLR
jgi:hypothetical protein